MIEIESPPYLLSRLTTPLAGLLSALCILGILVAFISNGLGKESLIPGIEVVGIDPRKFGPLSVIEAKKRFAFSGREMVFEAAKKVPVPSSQA
jgi:hypothetical protein